MSDTVAIVVTYNRKSLLLENISKLLAQKPVVPNILIIDNHSTDGTKEYIEEYIEKGLVTYLDTGANLGGAGGFQFGIKEAFKRGYKYFWIMDDDCMPHEDSLDCLMKADEQLNGNYGFLSSKVLWLDGEICKMNVQRKTLISYVKEFGNENIPIAMASFVSLFIKREVVEEMGLPIKEFFIWTDDWEYTRRISRKYRSYLVPTSVVTHKSAMNIGANIATDSQERLDRYAYLYRNDVYLYRREGIVGFAYELVRLNAHILRIIFKGKSNRIRRIGLVIRGTLQGFKFKPTIEYVSGDAK